MEKKQVSQILEIENVSAHVGVGHKAIPPLACKHAVESGF